MFSSVYVPDLRRPRELLNLEINSRTSEVVLWTNAGGRTQDLIRAFICQCATWVCVPIYIYAMSTGVCKFPAWSRFI